MSENRPLRLYHFLWDGMYSHRWPDRVNDALYLVVERPALWLLCKLWGHEMGEEFRWCRWCNRD